MIPALIGISSALMIILLVRILVRLLRQPDEKLLYGLILAGIGFLYVGFTWTDLEALISSSIQAIVFVLIACYGMVKNELILVIGYILHGCWDFVYHFINLPDLLPPHYDLFCSVLDFTIAVYLLYAGYFLKLDHQKRKRIKSQDTRFKLTGLESCVLYLASFFFTPVYLYKPLN